MRRLKILTINKKGFSLIEILVSLLIVMIIMLGIYQLIILSLQITNNNKLKVEAIEIAKQKMEFIHSLSYDNVGTISGNPSGLIPDCETVTRAGVFEVCTNIDYADDDFDGTSASTTPDTSPNDYKVATVKITWTTKQGAEEISLYTKIVPSTLEANANQGLLRIQVTDTGYLNPGNVVLPVSDAKVNIYNPLNGINVDRLTDANGYVNYMASSSEGYQIMVTHNSYPADYSYDQTYGTSTNKTPQHLTVYEGSMTSENFTIDKKGVLNIKTVADSNLPDDWDVNNKNYDREQKNIRVSKDASNNNLYFVWESESSTSTHVYIQRYNTAKNKIWSDDIKLSDTYFQKNPDIAVGDNGYSYVVWQDNSIALRKTAYFPINRFIENNIGNKYALDYQIMPNKAQETDFWHNFTNYFNFTKIINTNTVAYKIDAWKQMFLNFIEKKEAKNAFAAAGDYYGLKVQKYTGNGVNNEKTAEVFLTEPVNPNYAFVLMQDWWSTAIRCTYFFGPTSGGGCCQPDEHQANAYLDPSGMKVTVERSGISNTDNITDKNFYFSFYVIEAINQEFIVRARDSLTIQYELSSTTEIINNNFNNPDKITVFSNARIEMSYVDNAIDYNFLGYTTTYIYPDGSDYRIKADRGGVAPGCPSEPCDEGKYNTVIQYQIVEWLDPLIEVQTGEITANIGTAEQTFDLAASADHDPVIQDRTWLYGNMRHQSNGVAQTSVRLYLKDDNTIAYVRGANTYESTIHWWTIQFPRGVVVQRGTDSADYWDTTETATLADPVVLENTWSDSYRTSNYTDKLFPQGRWTETLISNTQIRWWRRESRGDVDFNYQVIDTSNWDRPVEIIASGTQAATLDASTTDQYLGGEFIVSKENFYSRINSITFHENGTVNAKDHIKNIKLTYNKDNTLPYSCDDVSYPGAYQFGDIDTDGFSGINGTSTFTNLAPVTVSATSTLCFYLDVDILGEINKYDKLNIYIDNPKNDIELQADTGYIKQTGSVDISGQTELLLDPIPQQFSYIWREDDGDEYAATSYTENSHIIKKPGEPIRVRFSLSNAGSKNLSSTYKLKYGISSNLNCESVVSWEDVDIGADWYSYNSTYLGNGSSSNNIVDISDPNSVFITGDIRDTEASSSNISLNHDNFTELEFSIISDPSLEDAGYCFKIEKPGDNSSFVYTEYPKIILIGDYNIFIKKIDNSDGSTVWTEQVNSDENPLYDRLRPRIALTEVEGDEYATVVWYDTRNNIYAQQYDQNGIRQWNSQNDLIIASTSAIEQYPAIASDSDKNIVIAWASSSRIFMQKFLTSTSTDPVSDWANATEVSSAADTGFPELTVDADDNYYIAWWKDVNDGDVFISKYSSSSLFYWKQQLNITGTSSEQLNPSLITDNTNYVYVSWTDNRRGNYDVYVQKLNRNTGAYVWPSDYRINFDTHGDDQSNSVLVMRGADPVLSWQDNNYAKAAHFRTDGPTALVIEPNIALTATSTKTSNNNPYTPKITINDDSDASGNLSLGLEYDFDGYYIMANGGRSITVSDPSLPISIEPDQIKNITLYID